MEVIGYSQLFSYQDSSKCLFCAQQKKETQICVQLNGD